MQETHIQYDFTGPLQSDPCRLILALSQLDVHWAAQGPYTVFQGPTEGILRTVNVVFTLSTFEGISGSTEMRSDPS